MGKKTRKRKGKKKRGGNKCKLCGLDKDVVMENFKSQITLLHNSMVALQREIVRLNQENVYLKSIKGAGVKKTRRTRRRQRGRR